MYMVKILFLFSIGFVGGLWIPWPGILNNQNWFCAKDAVIKLSKGKTKNQSFSQMNFKKIFQYERSGTINRLRIVGNSCFR